MISAARDKWSASASCRGIAEFARRRMQLELCAHQDPGAAAAPGLHRTAGAGARLDAALASHRLVLFSAPAGFGKTAALTRQIARLPAGSALAWISCDEDDDLQRLLACLCAALEPYDPPWRSDPDALAARGAGTRSQRREAADELLNVLAACDVARGCIVLDDLHRIEDPGVFEFLDLLLPGLPPHWVLVLSGREAPPLALARLRVQGELAEFRESDLQFDADEVEALLQATPGAAERVAAAAVAGTHAGLGGGPAPGTEHAVRWPRRRPARCARRRSTAMSSTTWRPRCWRACRPSCGTSCCAARCCPSSAPRAARRCRATPRAARWLEDIEAARPVRHQPRRPGADAAPARPVPRLPRRPAEARAAGRAARAAEARRRRRGGHGAPHRLPAARRRHRRGLHAAVRRRPGADDPRRRSRRCCA